MEAIGPRDSRTRSLRVGFRESDPAPGGSAQTCVGPGDPLTAKEVAALSPWPRDCPEAAGPTEQ